ncbi:hypothetical protein FHX77_000150 [Bifidobacterium commune]|nr:hypothetical protein [Bifidobacterium commune]
MEPIETNLPVKKTLWMSTCDTTLNIMETKLRM